MVKTGDITKKHLFITIGVIILIALMDYIEGTSPWAMLHALFLIIILAIAISFIALGLNK